MKINEYISEISTPTGSIFIRFKEKVGEVSANPQRGERSEATYLTAYAGFANAPEDLKQSAALRNFNAITSAQDIVNMIKSIFTDKVFLSAKSVTIYDDFTKPMQGDSSPIYKRHPFLLKFMKWVEREGGDRIQIADKVGQEGPPKLKRPRKENPNKGRILPDSPQGETKKTVTFTVGSRFYREIQNNLPNIMKYRGPNQTFVMPNEIFMAFRKQAEAKFPFADIKIQNCVATGEGFNEAEEKPKAVHCSQCGKGFSAGGLKAPHKTGFSHCKDHKGMKVVVSENLNEGQDKSPQDCGIVDGYYGRPPNPYKIEMGQRIKLTDPAEIKDYMAGYNDDSVGSKVYESDDPIDKDARDSYGSRAPGVKKLKDGKYYAVNADGEHKIFASKEQAERHAKKRKTNEDNMDITSSSQPDHEASMAKGELYNTVKNAKELFHMIKDGENLEGWVASKITRAADYINTVHDYMMYEKQYNESLNERSTSEKQARTMAAAAHDPKFAKKVGIKTSVAKEFNKADKGTKRLSNAMKKEDVTDEGGPASRTLCLSKRSDKSLGASNLASCKSQGLRTRDGNKSHKLGSKRVRVGGKKIKGKIHGGPLPDWS